jgi:hypothetical protein
MKRKTMEKKELIFLTLKLSQIESEIVNDLEKNE